MSATLQAVQRPGTLPEGANIDSLISVPEFAVWRGVSEVTAADAVRAGSVPGVDRQFPQRPRIHVRTYLAMQGKQFRQAVNV
jgi:hypothetical protein